MSSLLPTSVWVPLVTQETVVPELYVHLERYLSAPAVSFPGEDREFGWLYVNTAQDFRIEPPSTITLTASVTNITGSVSGSITATPEETANARKLVGLDETDEDENLKAFDKRLNDQVARLLVDRAARALVEDREATEARGERPKRTAARGPCPSRG